MKDGQLTLKTPFSKLAFGEINGPRLWALNPNNELVKGKKVVADRYESFNDKNELIGCGVSVYPHPTNGKEVTESIMCYDLQKYPLEETIERMDDFWDFAGLEDEGQK